MNSDNFRDDEIDLIELFEKIWDGKLTVFASAAIPAIAIFAYQLLAIEPKFEAQTPINPISSSDIEPYAAYNSLEVLPINAENLQNLYIETIRDQEFLVESFKDITVIDPASYDSADAYDNAVRTRAASAEVQRSENDEEKDSFNLVFSHTDEDAWKEAVTIIDDRANEEVRETLQRRFQQTITTEERRKDFELEDLNTSIENLKDDYDIETENRVAYLEEQAQIARALQIPKNTFSSQTFDSEEISVTTITEDNAFYLRGYEAIEKEIELINNRSDKSNFIPELVDLRKQRRSINQDQSLQRAQQLFSETPITDPEQFKAANMSAFETNFEYSNKPILTTVISAFFGGFIGIVFVLIRRAIKDRRKISEV